MYNSLTPWLLLGGLPPAVALLKEVIDTARTVRAVRKATR